MLQPSYIELLNNVYCCSYCTSH